MCVCRIGNFGEEIEWEKLLALACTALEKVSFIHASTDQVYRESTLLTKNGICGEFIECEKFAHVQLLTLSCVCL